MKSAPSTSARRCGAASARRAGPPLRHQPALVPDGKAHVGPRQRVAAHGLQAVRQFGGVGLEELAPRRRAEEQLAHLHRGAHGARGRAAVRRCGRPAAGAWAESACGWQRQLGHRGDGGQRLAAKAHGAHRLQVGQAGDLAGGVAPQRQRQLVGRDAGAVVLDHDAAHAARQQPHGDLAWRRRPARCPPARAPPRRGAPPPRRRRSG
jgi:hypothetical protein